MRIPLLDEDRSVAKGRSSLARRRWPHAQIKVTVATLDLKKEQQREKREKRREKRDGSVPEGRDGREKGRALGETREERKEKREDPCRNNEQLYCNRVCTFPGRAAAREERREKRKERREKREEITKKAARDPQID